MRIGHYKTVGRDDDAGTQALDGELSEGGGVLVLEETVMECVHLSAELLPPKRVLLELDSLLGADVHNGRRAFLHRLDDGCFANVFRQGGDGLGGNTGEQYSE